MYNDVKTNAVKSSVFQGGKTLDFTAFFIFLNFYFIEVVKMPTTLGKT